MRTFVDVEIMAYTMAGTVTAQLLKRNYEDTTPAYR